MAERARRELALPFGLMVAIMAAGLVALASAVAPDRMGLLWRQLLWDLLAIGAFFAAAWPPPRWYRERAHLLLAAVAVALVLVLAIGAMGGGSRRWLGLGPIRVQPSEFAKLAVILWTARWAAGRTAPIGGARLRELWLPLLVVGGVAGLVLVQPDLGTAVAVALGGLVILYVYGIRRRLLVGAGIAGMGLAAVGWFFVLRPYQKRRIFAFLDPEADPLGAGYHTIQSKIAVGSGRLWGTGPGRGIQSSLHFLPEQHTDFIFSVWAEEWGFVGAVAVLVLYAFLVRWLIRTALESRTLYGRYVAAGIAAHFLLHVGVNVAMVVGLAPVVGLPLPWMSYGGSAALLNALALGIAVGIRRRRRVFGG